MARGNKKILLRCISVIAFVLIGSVVAYFSRATQDLPQATGYVSEDIEALKEDLPEYFGYPWAIVNGNVPFFEQSELEVYSGEDIASFESYSDLDWYGRCGAAEALVSLDTMPTEERESISSVKPTGWRNKKYDADLVDGEYIYNRCHLIGFQLTAENANEKNLITGTRYLNIEGMLGFENDVADYIASTGKPVLYRVTPIFVGDELVARGVLMEAYSVADEGAGVRFCVYCFNVQPGVEIDYATGENWLVQEERVT